MNNARAHTRFTSLTEQYRHRYREHGSFRLLPAQSIDRVVSQNAVANKPGVYVIYAVTDHVDVAYIGKAGTLNNNGTWKEQMLAGRLCAKQDGMARRDFFQKLIADTGAHFLFFEWFVTISDRAILPALAENELLQAYFEDNGRLPLCNRCA